MAPERVRTVVADWPFGSTTVTAIVVAVAFATVIASVADDCSEHSNCSEWRPDYYSKIC